MTIPDRIRIVEVGPRDGLQNESTVVPAESRARLIDLLAEAGLTHIEAGSFVSSARVPQMASSAEVLAIVRQPSAARLSVLVPNLVGLRAALAAGAREIAVPASASETFSRRNLNCGIDECLSRFSTIVAEAARHGILVRGYVSCVLGCPYEGEIDPQSVARVAKALHEVGCYEISLGDTIGVGAPLAARRLLDRVARDVPLQRLAVHFHDTYGQALANIFACLEMGVATVDSSIAGLGGCPYAPAATGNVATEDLVYMLEGSGIETGVDLDKLLVASAFICQRLGRAPESRVARALAAKRARPVSAAFCPNSSESRLY
jgi:hydroxymethylglutaryl-CoA lyase